MIRCSVRWISIWYFLGMKIGLLSAPSNLGLRPPAPTSVPGHAKAPEALREAGLYRRLAAFGAEERGVVLPGRYAYDATLVCSATRAP
jgi:arginase